jgi:hypothetical protein
MTWENEALFVEDLEKCLVKASTGKLARIAQVAVDDEKQVRCLAV